jgi:hypothetical protein
MKSLLWVAMLLVATITYSQDPSVFKGAQEAKLPMSVPPAPNSASLIKNVNESVDLYTGRTSANIPLYTLTSGELSVPISINGSLNSHKVNDYGSWVGLGWNLSAGGSITRMMRGSPDEYNGRLSSSIDKTVIGYLNVKSSQNIDLFLFDAPAPVANRYDIPKMRDITIKGAQASGDVHPTNYLDLEPDEFYFNFGNLSGKFVFDQDGNIVILSEQNIKIDKTVSGNKIQSFKITTDDGTVYDFGNYSLNAVEETKNTIKSESSTLVYIATGCYNEIGLNFRQNGVSDIIYSGPNFTYGQMSILMADREPAPWINNAQQQAATHLMDFNYAPNIKNEEYYYYPSTWHLTKITSSNGDFINFSYTAEPETSIISDVNITSAYPDAVAGKSVSEDDVTCTPQLIPRWFNTYFYSIVPPKPMFGNIFRVPYTAGPSFYPHAEIHTITTTKTYYKTCRLTSINSSFGSNVSFVALTVRTDLPNARQLDKIIINNGQLDIKSFQFVYQTIHNSDQPYTWTYNCHIPLYFYNDRDPYATSTYYYTGTNFTPYTIQKEIPVEDYQRKRMYLLSIREIGTNGEQLPPYQFFYKDQAKLTYKASPNMQDVFGFNKDKIGDDDRSGLYAGVCNKILLPTGGFKEFTYGFSGNTNSWNGLRISKKAEKVSATDNTISTDYEYGQFISADIPITEYRLPDVIYKVSSNPDIHAIGAMKRFVSNRRFNVQQLTAGTAGGYDFVIERKVNNGYKKYEFYTYNDFADEETTAKLVTTFINDGSIVNFSVPGNSFYYPFNSAPNHTFPFPQVNSNDCRRGLLKREYIYDNNEVRLSDLEYLYDWGTISSGLTNSIGLRAIKYTVMGGVGWNWFIFNKYSYTSKWKVLSTVKRIEKDKLEIQKESISNLSYTKYNLNGKTFLYNTKNEIIENGLGVTFVNETKYPLDYSFTSPGNDFGVVALKSKFKYGSPVEKLSYKIKHVDNSKVYLDGQIFDYNTGANLKRILKFRPAHPVNSYTPTSVSSNALQVDPDYKQEILVPAYNSLGRLLEQQRVNDLPVSFVWDSKSEHIIGEVVNAKSSEVFFDNMESANSWSGTTATAHGDKAAQFDNTKGKTGKYAAMIVNTSGPERFCHSNTTLNISLSAIKKYIYSAWVYSSGPPVELMLFMKRSTETGYYSYINSIIVNSTNKWTYVEKEVDVPADVTKLNLRVDNNGVGSVWFDDAKILPSNAQIKTYTHEPLIGVTSITDNNNQSTYYSYDNFNRLTLVRDNWKNIVNAFCYTYGAVENCRFDEIYGNDPISGNYYSTNCQSGFPLPYPVTILANEVTSAISKADANSKASLLAQQRANQYGQCGTSSNVQLYFSNVIGLYGLSVRLFNENTYQEYIFSNIQNGSYVNIGSVPAGTYTVTFIAPSANYYFYTAGCGYYGYGDYNSNHTTIYSVPISNTCNYLEISY